jgi:hypothetical protein
MKTPFIALTLFALACANHEGGPSAETTPVVQGSEGKVLIAQARARLDANKDLASMKIDLQAALTTERVAASDAAEAKLLIAKMDLALGAKDQAIESLEAILATQPYRSDTNVAQEASEALRDALRTSDKRRQVEPFSPDAEFAPIALALADYFPVKAGTSQVKIVTFGGRGASASSDATFEIGNAARSKAAAACALCESLKVSTSFSRHGDWAGMFSEREMLEESLVVYYYDLGANKIPSRYDSMLPMPTKEIDAELEKGNGLVAAKQRAGKPPVIVLAAPRPVQLRAVQTAFAEMKTVPQAPVTVKVSAGLMKDEIQAVVRSGTKKFRVCYESLLQANPNASGTFELAFAVDGKGVVNGAKVTTKSEPLRDPTFLGCITKETEGLEFPETHGETTVRYPITVHP